MKNASLLVVNLLACMLTGCTALIQPAVFRPPAPPARFIVYEESGQVGRRRFIADGTRACYESYSYRKEFQKGPGTTLDFQVQVLPMADDWKKFWDVVDKLELARWKPNYSQIDIPPGANGERMLVTDVPEWSLHLSTPRGDRKIVGDAHPVKGHPERAFVFGIGGKEKSALQPLETAFGRLVGLPRGR